MQIVLYFLAAAAAYLIGSFSPAIYLSRHFMGKDVRKQGSGNAGATNMARVYGIGLGVVTMLCDCAKAVLAILLGKMLLGEWGIFVGGVSCLVGHCFPVFHEFKGGKGVSVGAAIAFAVDWRVFLVVVSCFALGAVFSRKVSVGSVLASLSIAVAALCFGVSLPRLLLAISGMLLVSYRHKDNIVRVIKGEEPDFKAGCAKKTCIKTNMKKNDG